MKKSNSNINFNRLAYETRCMSQPQSVTKHRQLKSMVILYIILVFSSLGCFNDRFWSLLLDFIATSLYNTNLGRIDRVEVQSPDGSHR